MLGCTTIGEHEAKGRNSERFGWCKKAAKCVARMDLSLCDEVSEIFKVSICLRSREL